MKSVVILVGLCSYAFGADNVLSANEEKAGFSLLFDGRSFGGWRAPQARGKNQPAWVIEDGTLRSTPTPVREDLITEKTYGDFELKFDWRISRDGNTGIKYRIQKAVFVESAKRSPDATFESSVERAMKDPDAGQAKLIAGVPGQEYTIAYEFQLIDDNTSQTLHKEQHTGSLYSMVPPEKVLPSKPGEWYQSRLVVKGEHFEHWINGIKVLEGSLKSDAGRVATSTRWANAPMVREMLLNASLAGPLSLQHHGTPVWFKNIKIRALEQRK